MKMSDVRKVQSIYIHYSSLYLQSGWLITPLSFIDQPTCDDGPEVTLTQSKPVHAECSAPGMKKLSPCVLCNDYLGGGQEGGGGGIPCNQIVSMHGSHSEAAPPSAMAFNESRQDGQYSPLDLKHL